MRIFGFVKVTLLAALLCLGTAALAGDKPSFDVNWYGAFQVDGAYDQNLTSHGNFSMWVQPQSIDENDEQFNMTANATRFGVVANTVTRRTIDITGQLEFDLYAGVFSGATTEENNPMLLLRHAYFQVESPSARLTAGQTWDLVSPLNPPTLNYASLWGCGNIGYRRPQISAAMKVNPDANTDVTVSGGFFRTIGSDLTPTFSLAAGETRDISDDGTDAGIPSFQTQININHQLPAGDQIQLGISGLYGKLKAETNLGNYEKYESWAVSGYGTISLVSGFGVAGELFVGSNLHSYFGGILNDSRIQGVAARGGWGAAWIQPTEDIRLNAGMGIDDPKDEDLVDGRTQNRCIFANVNYSFVPQVTFGFEVSQWETRYKLSDRAENVRAQTSLSLNF